MLTTPTRRDLIKYGIGALTFAKMSRAQGVRVPGPGGASASVGPIVRLAHCNGPSGSTTSGSMNTTGAKLIIIAVESFGGTITPTDSKSNTYTALTNYPSGFALQMFYCINPTNDAALTIGYTGANNAVAAAAYSNVVSFGTEAGNAPGSGSNIQPGPLTPDAPNALLVSCARGGGTVTSCTGMTIFELSVPNFGLSMADVVQTTAGALNPTWNGDNDFGSCTQAYFRNG